MENKCKYCKYLYSYGYDAKNKIDLYECTALFDSQEGGVEVTEEDGCTMKFKQKETNGK